MRLRRGTFKHIEDELFAYHDTLSRIEDLRQDILYRTEKREPEQQTADPTGSKGTALATDTRLKHMEQITSAIYKVYQSLPDEQQELVHIRYWSKKRMNWIGISQQLNVHHVTASKWRSNIIKAIANELGWR